ncbi:MAG TPA: hypothetical protein VMU81_02165 [Acetobacteraceae bacterium]|nr:hypothetical protein [Acetobacteraceae bacterium]
MQSVDRIFFVVSLCFVLIVPPLIGLVLHDSSVAWLTVLCGSLVAFLSRIEALAELRIGPLRATMREKIAEAVATVEQLRELATSITTAFLTDLIGSSFMGVMSNDRRLRIHDELIEKLRSLGATDSQINRAEKDWRDGISIVYYRIISNEMQKAANHPTTAEHNKMSSEMQSLVDFRAWKVALPTEYEKFARDHQVLTQEVQSWIDDYRHFLNSNEIRRRSEFVTR